MARFRFVLVRAPDTSDPRTPVGLVYRARAHGEHIWVMTVAPRGATHAELATLLALLTVDQALQVLPPQESPQGPGIGLLGADGRLRNNRRRLLAAEISDEVRRIAQALQERELYYLERLRRYFATDGLPVGFEPVPDHHPSHDPALEQVFAPLPPLLPVRTPVRAED